MNSRQETNLESLSAKELRELAARASFLAAGKDERIDLDTRLVQAMDAVLFARTKTRFHEGVAMGLSNKGALFSASPVMKEYILTYFKPRGPGEWLKAYAIIVEAVADQIAKVGAALTARKMVELFGQFPAHVNAAFPGYAESGMLGILLKQEHRPV